MISELCIYRLDEGTSQVLLRHEGHIEAPNWHPDGYLVVNGGGRLFRVSLGNPAMLPIDTGHAIACNNDHGISPDGQSLVISDSSVTNESCIYTLPIAGGVPKRVTARVPSYWHGWSPDGHTLAYVGKRDGRFVLLTCPVTGGDETCLNDSFDHVDGPDYSPDGEWIWFNAEREGEVDLWRIHPDGTGLQRMTDDIAVNWFPHPSPDGQHIVYLAYPYGTQGHPANLDVRLCLMSADGGPSRPLCDVFGGQGTLNVPSWALDSSAFAYVRYVL